MEDRLRSFIKVHATSNAKLVIQHEFAGIFVGYKRNLMHTQNVYIKMWLEKDALVRVAEKADKPRQIPVVTTRVYCSISCKKNYVDRLRFQENKRIVMLYMDDHNPTGLFILPAIE